MSGTSGSSDGHVRTSRPKFLITIDTEGDNLWSKPRTVTTRNSKFLPRFQALCERHGLKPTYLTNYEMANCSNFLEFGRDILKRGTAEIGMHLHAWNTPPHISLTQDDLMYQPYLIEYPEEVMWGKVAAMTDLLEERFGDKMISHRAGRWGLDETYARILAARGYQVDCSVTPYVSWRRHRGNPNGEGGTDFTMFPNRAYFLDLNEISVAGDSTLLEVPMTIIPTRKDFARRLHRLSKNAPHILKAALNHLFPRLWLRPNGRNLKHMLWILKQANDEGKDYVEFMLHSSELMPGGSPTFKTDEDIESLYDDMEQLFSAACKRFEGATLKEYHREVSGDKAHV